MIDRFKRKQFFQEGSNANCSQIVKSIHSNDLSFSLIDVSFTEQLTAFPSLRFV